MKRHTRHRNKPRRRLQLESLEQRRLLAVGGIFIDLSRGGGIDLFNPTPGALQNGFVSNGLGVTIGTANVPGQNNQPPVAADDSLQFGEDASSLDVTSQLLANDSDVDTGDTLSIIAASSATKGSVSLTSGVLTYDPNGQFESLAAGETATDTFTYTIDDGHNAEGTATVTVTVTGVNDAPTFNVGADQSVNEDAGPQSVAGWATAIHDGDAGTTQTLTFNVISNSNTELFSALPAIDASGNLTYTTAQDANGAAIITFNLQDDGGTANGGADTSVTQSFTINVTPVNDPPSFTLSTTAESISENDGPQTHSGFATGISTGPSNEGGQSVSFVLTSNSNPSLFSSGPTIDPAGNISFTTANEADGVAVLKFAALDDGGTVGGGVNTSTEHTFTLTVAEINVAPILAPIGDKSVNEETTLSFTALAADADLPANQLTFSLEGAPTGASITSGGVFSWTPTEEQGPNAYTFTVVVTDNGSPNLTDSETITVTVAEANKSPTVPAQSYSATGNVPIQVGASVGLLVGVADVDIPRNTLSLSSVDATSAYGGKITSVDLATGAFTYVSAPGFEGTDTFDFTVTDGSATVTQTATVTVSDTIWFVDNSAAPGGNGTMLAPFDSFTPLNDDGTDLDDPGDVIYVATGAAVYNVTRGNPNVHDHGFELEDNQIVIGQGAQGATLAGWLSSQTDVEVAALSTALPPIGGTNPHITNTSGDVFTAASGNLITGVTLDPVASAGIAGEDVEDLVVEFVIIITSGGTNNNEGINLRTVTGRLTFKNVNIGSAAGGTNNGPAIQIDGGTAELTFDDVDIDQSGGTLLNIINTFSSTLTFDDQSELKLRNSNQSAVTIANNDGGTVILNNDGLDVETEATVVFNVVDNRGLSARTPVNDAPSFRIPPQAPEVFEDSGPQVVSGFATHISPGPDANEADQTVAFTVLADPGLFAVQPAIDASGNLTYTPADNAFGTTRITVQLQDDGGTEKGGVDRSDVATFSIVIKPVNDPPKFTLGPNPAAIPEDAAPQTIDGFAHNLHAGPVNEIGQLLSFDIIGNSNPALFATGPTISPNGKLTYTPAPNANGVATITVGLRDDGGNEHGGSDRSLPQTFDITIAPAVNDPPMFDLPASIRADLHAGSQTINGFVSNIHPGPADEVSQTVSLAIIGNDNAGIFATQPAIDNNGTLTFAPAANGTATITVQATDNGGTDFGGNDTSPPRTFTITISEVVLATIADVKFEIAQGDVAGETVYFSYFVLDAIGPDSGSQSRIQLKRVGDTAFTTPALDGGIQQVGFNYASITDFLAAHNGLHEFGIDNDGDGTFEDSFTIDVDLDGFTSASFPGYANITSPSGTIDDTTPTITWDAISGAASLYISAVANNDALDELWYTEPELSGNATSVTTPLLPTGQLLLAAVQANFLRHDLASAASGDGVVNLSFYSNSIATSPFQIAAPVANAAPTINAIGNRSVNEGALLSFNATATDPNEAASGLKYSLDGVVPTGASITQAGVFTWTPTSGQIGAHAFDVIVTDNGTPSMSHSETITVTVNDVASVLVVDGFDGNSGGVPTGWSVPVGDPNNVVEQNSAVDFTTDGLLAFAPDATIDVQGMATTFTAHFDSLTGQSGVALGFYTDFDDTGDDAGVEAFYQAANNLIDIDIWNAGGTTPDFDLDLNVPNTYSGGPFDITLTVSPAGYQIKLSGDVTFDSGLLSYPAGHSLVNLGSEALAGIIINMESGTATASLTGVEITSGPTADVILDDGFNDGTGGVPDGWTVIDVEGTAVESGSTLTLTGGPGNDQWVALVSDELFNVHGRQVTYTASVLSMTDNPAFYFALIDLDSNAGAGIDFTSDGSIEFTTPDDPIGGELHTGLQLIGYNSSQPVELSFTIEPAGIRITAVQGANALDSGLIPNDQLNGFSLAGLPANMQPVLAVGNPNAEVVIDRVVVSATDDITPVLDTIADVKFEIAQGNVGGETKYFSYFYLDAVGAGSSDASRIDLRRVNDSAFSRPDFEFGDQQVGYQYDSLSEFLAAHNGTHQFGIDLDGDGDHESTFTIDVDLDGFTTASFPEYANITAPIGTINSTTPTITWDAISGAESLFISTVKNNDDLDDVWFTEPELSGSATSVTTGTQPKGEPLFASVQANFRRDDLASSNSDDGAVNLSFYTNSIATTSFEIPAPDFATVELELGQFAEPGESPFYMFLLDVEVHDSRTNNQTKLLFEAPDEPGFHQLSGGPTSGYEDIKQEPGETAAEFFALFSGDWKFRVDFAGDGFDAAQGDEEITLDVDLTNVATAFPTAPQLTGPAATGTVSTENGTPSISWNPLNQNDIDFIIVNVTEAGGDELVDVDLASSATSVNLTGAKPGTRLDVNVGAIDIDNSWATISNDSPTVDFEFWLGSYTAPQIDVAGADVADIYVEVIEANLGGELVYFASMQVEIAPSQFSAPMQVMVKGPNDAGFREMRTAPDSNRLTEGRWVRADIEPDGDGSLGTLLNWIDGTYVVQVNFGNDTTIDLEFEFDLDTSGLGANDFADAPTNVSPGTGQTIGIDQREVTITWEEDSTADFIMVQILAGDTDGPMMFESDVPIGTKQVTTNLMPSGIDLVMPVIANKVHDIVTTTDPIDVAFVMGAAALWDFNIAEQLKSVTPANASGFYGGGPDVLGGVAFEFDGLAGPAEVMFEYQPTRHTDQWWYVAGGDTPGSQLHRDFLPTGDGTLQAWLVEVEDTNDNPVNFNHVDLTLHYDPSQFDAPSNGANIEQRLGAYQYDSTAGEWVELTLLAQHFENDTITVRATGEGSYIVLGYDPSEVNSAPYFPLGQIGYSQLEVIQANGATDQPFYIGNLDLQGLGPNLRQQSRLLIKQPGETTFTLFDDGNDNNYAYAFLEEQYDSLAELIADRHGTYEVQIDYENDGTPDDSFSVTFDLSGLTDASLPNAPTITSPTSTSVVTAGQPTEVSWNLQPEVDSMFAVVHIANGPGLEDNEEVFDGDYAETTSAIEIAGLPTDKELMLIVGANEIHNERASGTSTDGTVRVELELTTMQAVFFGGSALRAAEGQAVNGNATALTQEQLSPIVDEAITRLESVGKFCTLASVDFRIADLPDGILGSSTASTVIIDLDAAGHGWFIDLTSSDDTEFQPGSLLAKPSDSTNGPTGRIDLLTVVMHELGHTLGLGHSDAVDELMSETLSTGQRRSPAEDFSDELLDLLADDVSSGSLSSS
ncbi:MAG: tandem-95 repeat protein [Planctomycetaceae bacterium]|nr:tandem-95 repeat protein [Planctomycetaceae bacterium]